MSGANRQGNARQLVRYVWEHVWKSDNLSIPELVGCKEIQKALGKSVYTAIGVAVSHPQELLDKCIDGYSTLSHEKALFMVNFKGSNQTESILEHIFFGPENSTCDQNARQYLAAYQEHTQKRLFDFDENDITALPVLVRSVLGISSVSDLPQEQDIPEPDRGQSGYHVIQIRWTPALEGRLRELLEGAGDHRERERFLQTAGQEIWEQLGITQFAAQMKAQELELVPPAVQFSDAPNPNRLVSYPLIEAEGYPFLRYAHATASTIETITRIDAHLFQPPVHGQHFRVNVPIYYKGILVDDYSPREWGTLQTIAAYIKNPNRFAKEDQQGAKTGSSSVWLFIAPEEVSVVPRIAATRVGEDQFAHLFLPVEYCADPGGVFSAVLTPHARDVEIYLFRHHVAGHVIREFD